MISKSYIDFVTVPATGTTDIRTGVVDREGNAFTPKLFIILGSSLFNQIEYNGADLFADAFNITTGFDDGGSKHYGEASSDAAGFGFKIVDGASSGSYSVFYVHAQLSFGGYLPVEAYISAVGAGQYSITSTLYTGGYPGHQSGRAYIIICLGGDSAEMAVGSPMGSGLPTILGFEPCGLIFKPQTLNSGTATATGAGGAGAFGFKTIDSGQALSASYSTNQGGVARAQVTNACAGGLNGSSLEPLTAVINSSGFTLSGSGPGQAYLAFGGTNLKAYCAAVTERLTTGQQTIDTNLTNEVVFFVSIGRTATGSVDTTACSICIGVTDTVRQGLIWAGEVGSNPSNPLGARTTRSDSLLRMGTANGGSTTFTDIATFVSNDPTTGIITINWSAVSGDANQFIVFALGPEANPVPPIVESGMYKLQPGKTNDTVWKALGVTEERKIP